MKRAMRVFALVMVCILVLGAAAFAAEGYTKQLTASYVGVSLVVDGMPIVPRDVNGNTVEPFIVDGTTYLPVRAVAEALGKEVSWDGDTKTVFIGSKTDNGLPEGYAAFTTSAGTQIIYTCGPVLFESKKYSVTQDIKSITLSYGYQYHDDDYAISFTVNGTVTGYSSMKLDVKCYDKDGNMVKSDYIQQNVISGADSTITGILVVPDDTVRILITDHFA